MKTVFTTCALVMFANITAYAQTLTYANFSASLTKTLAVNIANNASYNSSLSTTIGSNANWDASGLLLQSGTPTVNLAYYSSSATPQGNLYPNSNYCEYDPNLLSFVSYNYMGINADSVVEWGSYSANESHEIYQNPDKRLVFPFAFGQSFTDTYAKTNYSNATTVSSYQTGTRTVTFAGYGTLKLPQGTFSDVALITETRTNSLGPNSFNYSWIRLTDGKRLLYRSENNGSTTTVWSTDLASGLNESPYHSSVSMFPNPLSHTQHTIAIQSSEAINADELVLYDYTGKEMLRAPVKGDHVSIANELPVAGIYFYVLTDSSQAIASGKLIIQ